MNDVSLAIVNYNRSAVLEECLAAVYAHAGGVRVEVVVVDNASTDGSVEMVREKFPQVKLIVNDHNAGRAIATNQAIREGSGRYVFVLDNDAIVRPGTLPEMVRFMDEHPRAGVLSCELLNPDGSIQPDYRHLPSWPRLVMRTLGLDKLFPDSPPAARGGAEGVVEVGAVPGSCMFLRREVTDEVGLMDEQFIFYLEETDWCYRIRRAGWKIYLTTKVGVVHYGGFCSGQRISVPMHLEFYKSILKYYRKHHGRLGLAAAWLFSVARLSLRLLYWLPVALLRPPRREEAHYKIGLYWPALRWLLGAAS